MAELRERRARSAPLLTSGPAVCNPEAGRLTRVPEPPYTDSIAIEIGPYRLWMERAEFLALTDTMGTIAAMIRSVGGDPEGEDAARNEAFRRATLNDADEHRVQHEEHQPANAGWLTPVPIDREGKPKEPVTSDVKEGG